MICAILALLYPIFAVRTALAANPSSGSISSSSTTVTYSNDATGTGSASGEGTCVEGTNCDSYALTVSGNTSNWTHKLLSIKISWTNPANDYDLYIHKGDLNGPVVAQSANGAPETSEQAVIDPSKLGTGLYTIHTVYFANTPGVDQPTGTISVTSTQKNFVTPNWVFGGFTFSPNTTVTAPATTTDGEPSSRCDFHGNYYISGIRGVPAGVDLWYFDLQPNSPLYDPNMRNPIYRGQPDSFTGTDKTSVGADGGGDVDLAVGFADDLTSGFPTLAFSSLVAANISTGNSMDKGQTFKLNPVGNGTGGVEIDDRQWQQFYGGSKVYLLYRTIDPEIAYVQQSTDGGYTYGPAIMVGQIGQTGGIDVDQSDGTVYVSGSDGVVAVGHPDATLGYPTSYTIYQAASDPNGVAHIFFPVTVAQDAATNGRGHDTVYVCYSNDKNIFVEYSLDQGAHWSKPIRVNSGQIGDITNVFPRMAAGSTPGTVAITWYGTHRSVNDDLSDWRVFVAQSLDIFDSVPTFREQAASDHIIHASNISENGLDVTGNSNRNLLDYFEITIDPVGAMEVGYTDDHNDFSGNVYVTRQIGGPSMTPRVDVPSPVEGSGLPAKRTHILDSDGQVADPSQDVTDALLGVLPQNSPIDITEIEYDAINIANDTDVEIACEMTVSDLSTIPPSSTWRMFFTANAPDSKLSKTNLTTQGVSDRGDQFFVEAQTDAQGNKTYTWGTVVRNSDGSLTYTTRGNADHGTFNQSRNTVTVEVRASKLKPYLTHGGPITHGSILVGLRGDTSTVTGDGQSDATRGGTQYKVP